MNVCQLFVSIEVDVANSTIVDANRTISKATIVVLRDLSIDRLSSNTLKVIIFKFKDSLSHFSCFKKITL